ncbi:hypothetical protein [Flavobacterium sp.]|uniref:hypothetical protein n=1 Tax=Flavobacterium sp. TaxID=239 RepID=UPI0037530936
MKIVKVKLNLNLEIEISSENFEQMLGKINMTDIDNQYFIDYFAIDKCDLFMKDLNKRVINPFISEVIINIQG